MNASTVSLAISSVLRSSKRARAQSTLPMQASVREPITLKGSTELDTESLQVCGEYVTYLQKPYSQTVLITRDLPVALENYLEK
jgi:hypothetical protein